MAKMNATALALRLAETYDVDLSALSGSGSDGTVTARDVLEHRNPTSRSPTDRGSKSPIQNAEAETVVEAPSRRAPQSEQGAPILVLESEPKSPIQNAEAETIVEAPSQRAPQTQRRALILALEEAEEEESNSRRSDSDIPRWMFWRRWSD